MRVGARGYPITSGKNTGSQPTVANYPIKRAAAALYPGRGLRSLSDDEFWDCVRVARAWLRRAGEWARTTCRNGHELVAEKSACLVCEAQRNAKYRAARARPRQSEAA